jgi:uncharacterized protein (UPF0333 family)
MRAQISIEFVILFAVVLALFLLSTAYFPAQVRQEKNTEHVAYRTLEELKLQLIFASTSEDEFNATYFVPAAIESDPVHLKILGNPDNVAQIVKTYDNTVLARIFLPQINSVTDDPAVSGRVLVRGSSGGVAVIV